MLCWMKYGYNNNSLLIGTGTAAAHITSSLAAHANPIFIGTVTTKDNRGQDEMLLAEPRRF